MADLSIVDIEQVAYSLQSGITRLKRTALTRGGNKCGPCPKCHGNDRFYVLPEATDSAGNRRGKWACRNCHPQEGDAIELLVHMEGITIGQAFARLKEMYPELQVTTQPGPAKKVDRVRPLPETAFPPSAQWQRRAGQVIASAIKRLWDGVGTEALRYLLSRGLTEETVRKSGLGYIPPRSDGKDIEDDAAEWGITDRETVVLPSGILFPSVYKGEIWKLRVRRVGHDVPKDQRYILVVGSANGLYRADTLKVNNPALLFEGEINALSVAQEIGDLAACVATGSATHARIDQWKMRLALASQVLLCFDGDEAGQEAVTYWRKRLGEHASYLPASGEACGDANDMLKAGVDLVSWVTAHLMVPNGTNDTKSTGGFQKQDPQSRLPAPACPGPELEQLRREIGEMARAEEEQWELSDELDPAWPPSAGVRKRIRRKENSLQEVA